MSLYTSFYPAICALTFPFFFGGVIPHLESEVG